MTDGEPLPELSEFLPYVLKTFNCLTSISITVACGVKAFIGIVGFRIDVSQHDIAATGVTGCPRIPLEFFTGQPSSPASQSYIP